MQQSSWRAEDANPQNWRAGQQVYDIDGVTQNGLGRRSDSDNSVKWILDKLAGVGGVFSLELKSFEIIRYIDILFLPFIHYATQNVLYLFQHINEKNKKILSNFELKNIFN